MNVLRRLVAVYHKSNSRTNVKGIEDHLVY